MNFNAGFPSHQGNLTAKVLPKYAPSELLQSNYTAKVLPGYSPPKLVGDISE